MFKAKSKIALKSRKLVQVCSVSLLCWGSLFTPAWASLENTLEVLPQDSTLLTSMDISLEKWGYFWGRKPFSETFSSPEVQEQLKEFQEKTGIDFVKELLPLLGTHVSVGYYSPNHQFDSPFSGAQDRAKQSSIKANMHTLQTMIETYAVDWGGVYPKDLAILEKEAKKSGYSYWRDFTNPYTSKKGASHTIIDIKNIKPDSKLPGQVIYIPLTDSTKQITSYFLVGLDENGKLISDNNNGSFYLTNDGTDWNKPTGTYAKELIEAKKRLPGLGQKEAPPKKTDSVIFSLDLRSGQQTQPVLEKLIKTVNQKNKNRFLYHPY